MHVTVCDVCVTQPLNYTIMQHSSHKSIPVAVLTLRSTNKGSQLTIENPSMINEPSQIQYNAA